ncbi:MAG TPA: caspase family protein [Longimicrobium sp.]|nr:caspase family protein [Longimicrobium sp.]
MRTPVSLSLFALLFAASGAAAQPGAKAAAARAHASANRALPGPVGEVRAGTPVTGVLARGDSVLDDSSYVDVWTYRARKGERIRVSARSPKFDVFLRVDLPPTTTSLAFDDDGGGGTDARLTVDLLNDGTYTIGVNAFRKGETGSYTLSVESSLAGGEVAASKDWAALYPGGADPAERYAVLVGIEAYPSDRKNLDGPASDVRLMRDVLVRRFGFRPGNVVTLLDREGSREQIVQAVQRHLGQAGPDGVAVFYYSGHGARLEGNFATAGVADPEADGKDEAIAVWGSGQNGSLILDDELGALSEGLRAGRGLFIFDSCNSGTVLRGASAFGGGDGKAKYLAWGEMRAWTELPAAWLPSARGEASLAGALQGDAAPRSRMLVAASAEHESSWAAGGSWPGGGEESVFTHFFVEQLRAATAATTFQQAVDATFAPTTRYAKQRFGKAQSPRAEGTDVGTSIEAFLRKR